MKNRLFVSLFVFLCLILSGSIFAGNICFNDGQSRFCFDKKTGGLLKIHSKAAQKVLAESAVPRGLFELSLKKPRYVPENSVQKISADQCTLISQKTGKKGGSTVLTQTYLLPDKKSRVKLRITFNGKDHSSWEIVSIENRTGQEIFEVAFPIIAGIGNLGGGEMLFRGGCYYVFPDPFRYKVLTDAFPSRAPFPILDIFGKDGSGGVFLIDLDRSRQRTVISTRSPRRELLLIKTVKISDGQNYTSKSRALVGTHTGEWHTAGAIYRDFLKTGKNHVTHPEWFFNCHGCYSQGWGPRPRFSDLPYWCNAIKEESGMNFILYFNLRHRWLTQTPAPHLGTMEDLKWAFRKIRRNQLYFGYYNLANSFHPMVDREFLPEKPAMMGSYKRQVLDRHDYLEPGTVGRDSLRKIDGSVYFEWTRLKKPHDLTLANRRRMVAIPGALRLCLEQPAVQRYFTSLAQRFYQAGLDVFYWDTVGCGNHNCFDTTHKHSYGTYADGEAKYLADSLKIARKLNPDAAFMYESINITTGSCNGYLSAVHSFPAAIRFISPENIGMVGNANHPKDLLGTYLESFRCGMRLGGYNEWWEPDKNWVRLQQTNKGLLALRKAVGEFLYPADFLDTLGVQCSGKEVKTGLFTAPDKRYMIANITNRNREKGVTVTITAPEFQKAQYAYTVKYPEAEFERLPFRQSDVKITFEAPDTIASSVLFLTRPETFTRVTSSPAASGGAAEIKVELINLSPKAAAGTAALDLPEAWGKIKAQKFNFKKELEKTVLTFNVKVPASFPVGRCNIHAVVKQGKLTKRSWGLCFVEEPVRIDLAHHHLDKVKIVLQNLSRTRQDLTLELTGKEKSAFAGYKKAFSLKAGEKKTVFVTVPGMKDHQKPFRVNVKCTAKNWNDTFVETFWPIIANGDLELSEFNDWLPDYWWIANPERSKYPKQPWFSWTKDGGYKNNGRALKLAGGPKHQYSVSPVGPLKPGQRYKLSFMAKASAPCDAFVSCIGAVSHAERETFNAQAGNAAKRLKNFTTVLRLDKKAKPGTWKEYSAVFTVPEDMKLFSTYKGFADLYFSNRTPGTEVWFDNVRLVPFNGK